MREKNLFAHVFKLFYLYLHFHNSSFDKNFMEIEIFFISLYNSSQYLVIFHPEFPLQFYITSKHYLFQTDTQ